MARILGGEPEAIQTDRLKDPWDGTIPTLTGRCKDPLAGVGHQLQARKGAHSSIIGFRTHADLWVGPQLVPGDGDAHRECVADFLFAGNAFWAYACMPVAIAALVAFGKLVAHLVPPVEVEIEDSEVEQQSCDEPSSDF